MGEDKCLYSYYTRRLNSFNLLDCIELAANDAGGFNNSVAEQEVGGILFF